MENSCHDLKSKIEQLSGLLKSKDLTEQIEAIQELTEIGRPAVPALISAMRRKGSKFRFLAADALGKIGDQSAVPALVEALRDKEGGVSVNAATALSRLGGDLAVSSLIEALEEPDHSLRISAANALGDIGDKSAVPALVRAIKDENGQVRSSVVSALGKIGDRSAVPVLIETLKDDDEYARCFAAEALAEIGDPSAVPGLIEAIKDQYEPVRSSVIAALGKLGDPAAIPAIIERLEDKEEAVSARSMAVEALSSLGAEIEAQLTEEEEEEVELVEDDEDEIAPGDLPADYRVYDAVFEKLREAGGRSHYGHLRPSKDLVNLIESDLVPSSAKVIDFGCGDGRNAVYLAMRDYAVTAIDISENAIALARQFAKDKAVTIDLRVMDVTDLSQLADNSFDLALDFGCLHVLVDDSDRLAYLAGAFRVLKPGGTFYLANVGTESEAELHDIEAIYRRDFKIIEGVVCSAIDVTVEGRTKKVWAPKVPFRPQTISDYERELGAAGFEITMIHMNPTGEFGETVEAYVRKPDESEMEELEDIEILLDDEDEE